LTYHILWKFLQKTEKHRNISERRSGNLGTKNLLGLGVKGEKELVEGGIGTGKKAEGGIRLP